MLLLFLVNTKSRSKSKGKIKQIPPKIDKNGQSVITMYVHIVVDNLGNNSWHMNAWQLVQAVIVVYINMNGDTKDSVRLEQSSKI